MVMFGSRLPPDLGHGPGFPAPGWDSYGPLMAYPHDVDDGPLIDVLAAACAPSDAVEEYRRRFVGGPLDPARVVAEVEALVEEVAA